MRPDPRSDTAVYTICMFCNKPLGANEVVESFPVGRRLAFDAEKGRLWVVCRKCERWNLTPLEERWEAVEACEKLFRGTRVRVSSENIGLARHPEGLELVRIGRPLRPEFAAWRYGDQFGRRRRRYLLYGAAGTAAVGAALVGSLTGAAGLMAISIMWQPVQIWMNRRTVVRLRTDDNRKIKLQPHHLLATRIRDDDGPGPGFKLQIRKGKKKTTWHEGTEAWRVAGQILPGLNTAGGKRQTVSAAVARIEDTGHPERFLAELAASAGRRYARHAGVLGKLSKPTQLAFEMALHEEQERRALEGELWLLERAWEEAEEIAAISDDMFLPEGTEDFLAKHRPSGDG